MTKNDNSKTKVNQRTKCKHTICRSSNTDFFKERNNEQNLDKNMVSDEIGIQVMQYILTEHTLNKQLKLQGKQGEYSTMKLSQLYDLYTFVPMDVNT